MSSTPNEILSLEQRKKVINTISADLRVALKQPVGKPTPMAVYSEAIEQLLTSLVQQREGHRLQTKVKVSCTESKDDPGLITIDVKTNDPLLIKAFKEWESFDD